MRNVYAFLLSVIGLVLIVFNRLAVEETFRVMPWVWPPKPPVWLGRTIVILSGTFFFLFGVLTMMGYMQ